MDFNNNLPIYIQIMDYLKKQIISQDLKEGDKLDSVRELSKKLRVNPNTIQRSYQELEREGLVYTQRGMGTFVTEDAEIIYKLKREMASDLVSNFIMEMKQLGFNPDNIVDIVNTKVREV